jgi:hypothetical protein
MEKDSLQRKSEAVIGKIDYVLRKEPQKLIEMNKGKEGRPFLYSDTEIINASAFRFLMKTGLRQTAVLINNLGVRCASYSQLCRRLGSLEIKGVINKRKNHGRLVAIDDTGIATIEIATFLLGNEIVSEIENSRKRRINAQYCLN